MHKIFLLFSLVILPTTTFATTECELNNTSDGCSSYDGCEYIPPQSGSGSWTGLQAACRACIDKYYNNNSTNSTSCLSCDEYLSKPGQISDYVGEVIGQTECPWKCDSNYYKSGEECKLCPTGATSLAGSNSITDCQCSGGKDLIRNNNGTYSCGTCSQNSKYNHTTYTCDCATGADNNCQCTNNSSYDQTNNKCVCNNPYYPNASTKNGVLYCSACHQNAISDGGDCKCTTGYYGDGINACNICPAGTTTQLGAQNINDCYMPTNTKFCDANGQNCMKLNETIKTVSFH